MENHDKGDKGEIHNRLYHCLGKVVSERRKRLGLSQEELAEDANVDRAFISKIERGQRKPSFGLVSDLAQGLRMRYARLVHNCEECADDMIDKREETPD